MSFFSHCLIILLLVSIAFAHSLDEWRTRSVYQIVTDRFALDDDMKERIICDPIRSIYCGGTWNATKKHLDYIQELGFDAVWISPVFANIDGNDNIGEAYHGYWTKNIYQLNAHFGTEEDLLSLIDELHRRDMWIMMDIAINSMAVAGPITPHSFKEHVPFNNPSYYHPLCWVDYELLDIKNLQDCWLGDERIALADVDTENPVVVEKLERWIKDFVEEFHVDALRLDAVKHAPNEFWKKIAASAGVFTIGEYFTGSPKEACEYQKSGMDSFLNFPLYWPISWAFNRTGMEFDALKYAIDQERGNCSDVTVLGTFISNHDLPRIAHNNTDQARVMGAITFNFMFDGIPFVYYGTEQNLHSYHDPFNREPLWEYGYDTKNPYYSLIRTMNNFRKQVIKDDSEYVKRISHILKTKRKYMVFQKGDVITVTGNWGVHSPEGLTIQFMPDNFRQGTELIDIISREKFKVNARNTLLVPIKNGFPRVLYPANKFKESLPQVNCTLLPEVKFVPSVTVTTHYVKPPTTMPEGYPKGHHPSIYAIAVERSGQSFSLPPAQILIQFVLILFLAQLVAFVTLVL
ncbi:alpha-amylase Aah2 [Schizosaccharomyces japonicus yFS275]|uniref:alpha-amylase n=1 Tax=Schizosaccharomyces japonicus (strain yFS275 / FY16936) TaxID=402676 RepID=B6JXA5_SCHJY|nr:alpha-amylase Aah2 [Schizosaccharomyces japonicus yFS275]EEB06006.2 alpha-amylase Aah2 [Schizosaccharomyces japonicus yFS275]